MNKTQFLITANAPIEKIKNISKEALKYFKKTNMLDKEKGGIDIYIENKDKYITLAYIGDKTKITSEELQNISAKYIKYIIYFLEKTKTKQSEINISIDQKEFNKQDISSIEKGIILAYLAYKDKNIFKKNNKPQIDIKITGLIDKDIIKISNYIHELRLLVSTPANKLTISKFIQHSKNTIKNNNLLKVKILDKLALKKENMNLHLAVGAGGSEDPALIVVEYIPKNIKKNDKPIILIGKGLIYDSGGLYLKPDGSMWDMYGDMAGAGTVITIMKSLKDLNINKKVIGICAMAENLVDEDSYKNGDIYTSKNGLTVEIGHTDAEGRLVLADAIAYAYEKYDPALVIDMATLTGGCVIALGEMYSGIFSESIELINHVKEISIQTNDWVWSLPLDTQIKELMKNDRADLSNISKVPRILSASTGAAFLSYFVKDTTKWVHIDMSSAIREKMKREYDMTHMIGSGSGFHLIVELLKKI